MKLKSVCISCFLVLLCSCQKSYKYVEITEEKDVVGGGLQIKENEPIQIYAENDSIAYIFAYEKFCSSLKRHKDIIEISGNSFFKPIRFKLLSDNNEDIAISVFIKDRVKIEEDIKNKIFSRPNNFKETSDKSKQENTVSTTEFDSVKVNALKKYFRVRKDEFSNNNRKWYEPINAPKYANMNGIYCYFQTENDIPSNLRFRVQYHADEWLFFKKIQFSIDSIAFEYTPTSVETDSGNGGRIWEWFDQPITSSDRLLIEALGNARSAKMKLIGRQYYDIKTITIDEINSIGRTLDMYRAMGGSY
jgi:hypothetical protein